MTIRRALTCILVWLIFHAQAFAQDKPWKFVWLGSGIDRFEISKGSAETRFDKQKVSISLKGDDGSEYLIDGFMSKGKLNVKVTQVGSDYFDKSDFKGTYSKKTWSGMAKSVGRESIILTDGWNVIALTRELVP